MRARSCALAEDRTNEQGEGLMRALRFHGAGDCRLEDIPESSPPSGWVKVKVHWCGICGSDVHQFTAGPIVTPTEGRSHPLTGENLPLTMGHEFAGEIVEIGSGVEGLAVGDLVAVEPTIYCRKCSLCRRGAYNRCYEVGAIGVHGWGGGFSEYTTLPSYMAHRLPEGLPTDIGALVEPIAVGWQASREGAVEPGQTALVIGAGPIGLGVLLSLKVAGVLWVTVAEVHSTRRSTAEIFDANLVLDASRVDVSDAALRATHGKGVDVVFETSGSESGLRTAIASVRPGGTVVSLALWERPVEVDLTDLLLRGVRIVTSRAYPHRFPAVIAAIASGAIRPGPMVTRHVLLDDVIHDGFHELANHTNGQVKILATPIPELVPRSTRTDGSTSRPARSDRGR